MKATKKDRNSNGKGDQARRKDGQAVKENEMGKEERSSDHGGKKVRFDTEEARRVLDEMKKRGRTRKGLQGELNSMKIQERTGLPNIPEDVEVNEDAPQ